MNINSGKHYIINTLFIYLYIFLYFSICLSFTMSIHTERKEKDKFIELFNSVINKTFYVLYLDNQYEIDIKTPSITFSPESIEEEDINHNYSIIYKNVTIEMFFLFDIVPIFDEIYMEDKMMVDNKMGYSKIKLNYLILNETLDKSFNYTQNISYVDYHLDDVDSFYYFKEALTSGNNLSSITEDIWKKQIELALDIYPPPLALEMYNMIVYLLKYYKEFPIYYEPDNKKRIIELDVIVNDISFMEFHKLSYNSGRLYAVEFDINYNEKQHKVIYEIVEIAPNTFNLMNLRKGDYLDDYVCNELARIGLELYSI